MIPGWGPRVEPYTGEVGALEISRYYRPATSIGDEMKQKVAALAAFVCLAATANAATQCVNGSGTYGAVTVTISGTSCSTGGSYAGAGSIEIFGVGTCTITFSKPLDASTFRITLGDVNPPEITAIEVNGLPYAVSPADILTTPDPIWPGSGTVQTTAGEVNYGSGVVASGSIGLSGFTSGITSLSLIHRPSTWTTVYRVCADDAGVTVAAPTASTSIPTLSEWGLLMTSALVGLFGFLWMRRRS